MNFSEGTGFPDFKLGIYSESLDWSLYGTETARFPERVRLLESARFLESACLLESTGQ